jgi:hypothetical protein
MPPVTEVVVRETPVKAPVTMNELSAMLASSCSVQTSDSSIAATVVNQVEILTQFKMDGSSEYPYIIIVNHAKPEANWGFEVSLVQQIEHQHFTRDIYHIRKETGLSQENE